MSRRPVRAARIPGAGLFSVIYSVFRRLCLVVDEANAVRLSRLLIDLVYRATRKKRFANYHLFYGTNGDDKLYADLDREYLRFVAGQTAEVARGVHYKARFEKRHILRGCEHLDAALKLKHGVMLIAGHLGNFYSYHGALTKHGYKVTNISEAIPVASMERHIDRLRKTYNITTVFLEQGAARAAIKTLRAGEIFSVIFELSLRPEHAVSLRLGNAQIGLDIGPALMAVKLGVPVLAVNAVTRKPFHPESDILPAFPEPVGATDEEKALNLLIMWRDWLEAEIKRRPEQWWAWSFIDLQPVSKS